MKQYFFNIFVSLSVLLNTILGGYPREALSERSGRAYIAKGEFWLRDLIDFLLFWDKDHCVNSVKFETTKELWDWTK